MNEKSKKELKFETILSLFFIILSFIICGYLAYKNWDIVSDPEQVQQIIASFGIWAPIVLMAAEGFQVVFPYLPGQILSVVGGYIYGVWIGTIFNLIGVCLGSLVAFYIARKVGRPLIERMFDKEDLEKFDHFFHKHGLIIVFLSRTQFFFPNDLISYGSGLIKRLSWKKYLIATFLGYIPHFILLTSVGAELQIGFLSPKMISYGLLILLMALIYAFRGPVYRFIHKEEDLLKEWIKKEFPKK